MAGLSLRRTKFDLRAVYLGFLMDKVASRQGFLQALRKVYNEHV
jgi:hypothetical protein